MHGLPLITGRIRLALALTVLLDCTLAGSAAAYGEARVVASIKPVHSLVSAVMAGVGEPYLAMRDAASHHGFNMRPSDAAALQEARLIFLIHESMEAGLAGAIDTLAPDARVIALSEAKGLVRRPLRAGGAFEEDPHHAHDGHEQDDDDDHGNREHGHDDEDDEDGHGHTHGHTHGDGHTHSHGHDHENEHGHSHGHDDDEEHSDEDVAAHEDDDHAKGPFDLHVWLDPANAEAIAHMIAATLSEIDPDNATRYEDNANELVHRLEDLTANITADVAPVRGRPFIVFHDGYRYFEDRFGLTAAGSAVVSPERSPGVRRIRELREKVRELGVVCVIDEPQLDRRLVNTVIEGTDVRSGTVDPMGAAIDSGPALYFTLLRNMAAAFRDCLAPPG